MRKRITCFLLAAALTVGAVPQVLAADASDMTDISGHWAQDSIVWSMETGLFLGMSEDSFCPDGAMSRAMFVTVLGRMAGIDTSAYQDDYLANLFEDVDITEYYAPYVEWAVRMGITKGTGTGTFSPDSPVTRQEMATFLVRYASIYNYSLVSITENPVESFVDAGDIAEYAADAVETMRITGLLNGKPVEDGAAFDPQGQATRAECAAVLRRMNSALLPYTDRELVDPTEITVSSNAYELYVGETAQAGAEISPAESTNQTVTWVSSDPSVATVSLSGEITAVGAGTAEIFGYTWNGLSASFTITCQKNPSLAYAGETYAEKCVRIFGEEVSDPRRYYQSAAEASSHMVEITIPVWDFADSTQTTKVTKYKTLTVHENIADTIVAIFTEIYNGDEQFPIKDIGCYRYEYGSEHMPGLAIDINYNENYECRIDGTALTGSYWLPGEDPYSIPADGDVVNAFRKYGFGWGGDWRSKKDYMHFSYFGT